MERDALIPIEKSREILENAFKKLKENFPLAYKKKDVEENFGECEDIVGFYIEIPICESTRLPVKFKLSGWLELDRRADDMENPRVWVQFAIVLEEFGKGEEVFGAGYKGDYRILMADYDVKKQEMVGFLHIEPVGGVGLYSYFEKRKLKPFFL